VVLYFPEAQAAHVELSEAPTVAENVPAEQLMQTELRVAPTVAE
jgi:hypothetical protein